MRRMMIVPAVLLGALGATMAVPAQAINSGSKLCNSSNSEDNVTVWGKGYGNPTHRVALQRTECTRVQPGDESSLIVEVHGNQFRVGYNGAAYQSWQQLPDTVKRFHPANKATIYFQLDWR